MKTSDGHAAASRRGLPVRSRTLAARLWWATLSYYGWSTVTPDEIADGANPCPWWAHALSWLHRLAERLPGCWPVFEPMPPINCDCEDCRGI